MQIGPAHCTSGRYDIAKSMRVLCSHREIQVVLPGCVIGQCKELRCSVRAAYLLGGCFGAGTQVRIERQNAGSKNFSHFSLRYYMYFHFGMPSLYDTHQGFLAVVFDQVHRVEVKYHVLVPSELEGLEQARQRVGV